MSISTALKARAEALRNREDGFTLIELLVVVIIIGILAAIAIPIYVGVQNNAKDSAIKNDLQNDKTAVVAYYTATSTSAAPTLDKTTLGTYGFSYSGAGNYDSTANAATYMAGATSTATQFCITAKSSTGNTFYITSSGGVTTTTCGTTPSAW